MGIEQRLASSPTRQPMTVEWFLALACGGPLEAKGRFELLDGEIFRTAPQHAQHARHVKATRQLCRMLENAVGTAGLQLDIFSQISVRLSEISMLDPDIAVALPRDDGPVPLDELSLVVEVSDSSLSYDLGQKKCLYAKHGVAEYWVVDLPNSRLHQMIGPTAEGYGSVEVHPFGAAVASRTLPQILVDTGRIA